jgi:hypothetical protein
MMLKKLFEIYGIYELDQGENPTKCGDPLISKIKMGGSVDFTKIPGRSIIPFIFAISRVTLVFDFNHLGDPPTIKGF